MSDPTAALPGESLIASVSDEPSPPVDSSSLDSSISADTNASDPVKSATSNSQTALLVRPSSEKQAQSLKDPSMSSWASHKKHFFILSSAGKPIWTRYGDESRLSSFMGVIQAIISFFLDGGDTIKFINAGDHRFVFLLKEPLYFVAVSRTGESDSQLRDQLLYLHNQILSVLTSVQLTRIFEQRVNFDLRRLLSGTEVFLDSLATLFSRDQSFTLGGLQCLRLSRSVRSKVGSILAESKIKCLKNLLYAMVVANGRLVTLLRPRKHSLHPSDLHLLFNMLTGSTTFHNAESWTPLCLPKFNSKGFLHAYICYVERDVSVVMISTDKDSFFDLSEWKCTIVNNMRELNLLESVHKASDRLYLAEDVGAPGVLHFQYKSKTHLQFTSPGFSSVYENEDNKKRIFRLYQHMHDRMHSKSRPLKLYYHNSDTETILGCITSSFELYVAFGPSTSKPVMISSSNQLLRWIKKNEDNLFITDSPVF